MPPRRRRVPDLTDIIDQAVDTAVGGLFERAEVFVERIRQPPTVRLPGEVQRAVYTCAACRRSCSRDEMEMLHPKTEFGVCQRCFKFMWTAAEEKLKVLATAAAKRRLEQQQAQARTQQSTVARRPPWEVLEIQQDASIEEIKKAFRRLAMLYHPDRLLSSASTEERETAKRKYEEIQRAQKVMLSVRSAPEG
jgi:hypothetical protein